MDSRLKKVLIIDNNPTMLFLFRDFVGGRFEILEATSLEKGKKLFEENINDLDVVVVDPRVPGDSLNSMQLVGFMSKSVFLGYIVASSNSSLPLQKLVVAGATHTCEKGREAARFVLRLLELI